MLRVTVEIVPHGDEDRKSVIALLDIWNDLTGTPTYGNYKYTLHHIEAPIPKQTGTIKKFKRAEGPLALIQKILGRV